MFVCPIENITVVLSRFVSGSVVTQTLFPDQPFGRPPLLRRATIWSILGRVLLRQRLEDGVGLFSNRHKAELKLGSGLHHTYDTNIIPMQHIIHMCHWSSLITNHDHDKYDKYYHCAGLGCVLALQRCRFLSSPGTTDRHHHASCHPRCRDRRHRHQQNITFVIRLRTMSMSTKVPDRPTPSLVIIIVVV